MQGQDRGELKAGKFPEGHAVVIGVASYRNLKPPLPDTVLADARDVAAVLTSPRHCGYDPANVRLLLDDEATLAGIRQALNDAARACGPDDTVVVFFSGHGGLLGDPADPVSALLPVDFGPSDPDATALLEGEFSATLKAIPAERLVVLLDACHSGDAGCLKTPGAGIHLGFTEKALGNLAQGKGRVLIASSRASEYSYTGPKNSVFTQHLLDALNGLCQTTGDGFIRIFEVFNHVSEQVKLSAPGPQHPNFKASGVEENFPIALDRGGVKSLSGMSGAGAAPERWRDLEQLMPDLYPSGPQDLDIWQRAGGDLSQLRLTSTGRAMWFSALRTLARGGGGAHISKRSLMAAALEDYPHHPELTALHK